MIRPLALLLAASPVLAQEMPVPSGLEVSFVEVILEPDLGFARFRFLAPQLGSADWGAERIEGDFAWLCDAVALPALEQAEWDVTQIIVSIADRPLEFGETDAEATQYFEGFGVVSGACEWEPF